MENENYSILIIDDINENLYLLFNILDNKNTKVYTANSGKLGIDIAKNNCPDLILLDIAMPIMNGFEVCTKLKNDIITKYIPIIFITARTEIKDVIKGLKLGAVDYITKPFNTLELITRVNTHLNLKKAKDKIQQQNKALKKEVTERKIAEKALLESNAKNRALLEIIPDIIFLQNIDGVYLEAYLPEQIYENEKANEIIGQNIDDILSPELSNEYLKLFKLAVETKKIQIIEYNLIKNNTNKSYEARIISYKDNEVLTIVRDITERKKARLRLKESEERLRSLINSVSDLIFYKDVNSLYEGCNIAFANYIGIDQDQINGLSDYDIYEKTKAKAYIDLDIEVFNSNKNYNHACWSKDINGDDYYLETIKTPILTSDGKTIGIVGISRDLTDKQKLEKELRELNATKDKFFSIIAHDLKNPFNTLINISELIIKNLNNFSPDDLTKFCKSINQSALKGYKLLENLLEWSRIQIGSIKISPVRINIRNLIREVKLLLNSDLLNKNLQFGIAIDESHYVLADKNMLNTIIRNLLSNSIKFTENGGKISVTTAELDNYIEISITDNGIGINAENITKLFKIDVSFSTEGTSGEKGTGLGLVLCKEFIESNNGKITVNSEPSIKTTFSFTLPKAKIEHNKENEVIDKLKQELSQFSTTPFNISDQLITEFKENLIPEYNKLSKALSLNNLKVFSYKLIEQGTKFKIDILVNYGQNLNNLVKVFDISTIEEILPLFDEFIKTVNGELKTKS